MFKSIGLSHWPGPPLLVDELWHVASFGKELAKFGVRAMLAGTMANLMSASIVGILWHT